MSTIEKGRESMRFSAFRFLFRFHFRIFRGKNFIHESHETESNKKTSYSGTDPDIFFRVVSPVLSTGIPWSTSSCGLGMM